VLFLITEYGISSKRKRQKTSEGEIICTNYTVGDIIGIRGSCAKDNKQFEFWIAKVVIDPYAIDEEGHYVLQVSYFETTNGITYIFKPKKFPVPTEHIYGKVNLEQNGDSTSFKFAPPELQFGKPV